jgi:catalase
VLVTDGPDATLIDSLRAAVEKAGAQLQVVAPKIGGVAAKGGRRIEADHALSGGPSIFFDAVSYRFRQRERQDAPPAAVRRTINA